MVAPTGPVYQHLQTSLKKYRGIANNGGWPTVPEGPTLHLGDSDPRVAIIRKRLAVTGRIEDQRDLNSTVFDQALKDAVRAFQDGEFAWETPVMVGKNYRQTPVFTGDIAYLESKKIQVIDNKGKIVDPSTVDWNKYTRSAPYTFRQIPGPHH